LPADVADEHIAVIDSLVVPVELVDGAAVVADSEITNPTLVQVILLSEDVVAITILFLTALAEPDTFLFRFFGHEYWRRLWVLIIIPT
jgi:hypothetical protein